MADRPEEGAAGDPERATPVGVAAAVHQHVDAAVFGDDGFDGLCPVGLAGDVEVEVDGIEVVCLHLLDGLLA